MVDDVVVVEINSDAIMSRDPEGKTVLGAKLKRWFTDNEIEEIVFKVDEDNKLLLEYCDDML